MVSRVGCSWYAPRLNVECKDVFVACVLPGASSYRLNPVIFAYIAMLAITGNVVTVNGDLGDYFSTVVIKGSVEYESCMLICAARIVLISSMFSYIVAISGHAIDIVLYCVGFEVS